MVYVLLCMESLAVSLLLVALALACSARLSRRWARRAAWIAVPLLLGLVYLGLTAVAGIFAFRLHMAKHCFGPLLALTVGFLAGAVILRLCGFAANPAAPPDLLAATWPRARLAGAAAVALALHLITFWNLDLSVRQQMDTISSEAGALALSVAPARLPDRDNAALIYQQAFEAMGETSAWPKEHETWAAWVSTDQAGDGKFSAADAGLRRFLQERASVRMLLVQAARKAGCYFDRNYGRPRIDMLLPELASLRDVARILAWDARVRAADGDLHGAIEDTGALFVMAEHTGSEPLLISMLVACAIDNLALNTLQAVVSTRLPSAEDLAGIDLSTPLVYQRLLERAMRMEEAFGAGVFCDVALGRLTMDGLSQDQDVAVIGKPLFAPLYRICLLDDDLAAHRRYMAKYRGLASQPYYRAKTEWTSFDQQFQDEPGGPLTKLLFPALKRCAMRVAEADARRRLAQLAVGMLRQHAERGQFPAQLADLVPAYVPFVPADPFDGRPLRLKRTGRSLILYSVGPNLTDDGGQPLVDRNPVNGQPPVGDIIFRLPLAEG